MEVFLVLANKPFAFTLCPCLITSLSTCCVFSLKVTHEVPRFVQSVLPAIEEGVITVYLGSAGKLSHKDALLSSLILTILLDDSDCLS